MAEVIRMPRMSDTMEEGNIVGWLKAVGDEVEPGDVLAEVETDKATMELESYFEGVLLHIGVEEGSVPVNAVLAVIGEKGEDFQAALDAETGGDAAPETDAPAESTDGEAHGGHESAADAETSATSSAAAQPGGDSRVKASPLARSIAAEAGLDLSTVTGSGDGGRVVKRDVEEAIGGRGSGAPAQKDQSVAAPAPAAPPAFPAPQTQQAAGHKPVAIAGDAGASEGYTEVATSQMRKVIARRLAESKFSAPHFYLGIEVDMSAAIAYRKELNSISETRVSFNDLIVKACAHALRKHPAINSSWLGDKIRYNTDINIGVAVAVEDGLLVPVIRHADRKGYGEINAEVKEKAGLAKQRKLPPQDMTGNTFTISNLGMFDITEFTAIINPPDACILAVGSIQQKPVVRDGEVVAGNVMKLTLSCDHRVVDGATGAAFLATLEGMLQGPMTMLL